MPSKPFTDRRKHTSEIVASIITLRVSGQSYSEIAKQLNLARSTVITIVHRAKRAVNATFAGQKRLDRPFKLNDREIRTFIRHVDRFSENNLKAFAILFKSGHKFFRNIVRKYTRSRGYFRFKVKKKSFLTERHKKIRLKWGLQHKHWTIEDWGGVAWTDEATYEIGEDTRTRWVTRKKGHAMKARYLKVTFKSERSTVGIWGCITLKKKVRCSFWRRNGEWIQIFTSTKCYSLMIFRFSKNAWLRMKRWFEWTMGPRIILLKKWMFDAAQMVFCVWNDRFNRSIWTS